LHILDFTWEQVQDVVHHEEEAEVCSIHSKVYTLQYRKDSQIMGNMILHEALEVQQFQNLESKKNQNQIHKLKNSLWICIVLPCGPGPPPCPCP
jgi:hypothetical protein